jgi:methyl-accepting chemotaxis protein
MLNNISAVRTNNAAPDRSSPSSLSFFTGTVRARLITLIATLLMAMLVIGGAGMMATRDSNAMMRSMYEDRTVALGQLFQINDRMQDNVNALLEAGHLGRSGKPTTDIRDRIQSNVAVVNKTWAAYIATYLTPEEKIAADKFERLRTSLVEKVIRPSLSALADGKHETATDLVLNSGRPILTEAKGYTDKLTEIQVVEANKLYEAGQQRYTLVLVVACALLAGGILAGALMGLSAIRAITRPLDRLNSLMEKIGRGIFDTPITIERDDELGQLTRGMQAMQAQLGFDRDAAKENDHRVAAERRAEMRRLADDFETAVGDIVNTVSSASSQLESAAGALNEAAGRAQKLTTAVSASSEEASTNVQSVASASEELSSSVNEISRQVQESARMSNEAVDQARTTNDRVSELSQAAARIGDVVELISTIAGQTNLLALNATIEAARAGEAGRGFAVVATEVKALAEQTAKATGEISQQISGIQAATHESVGAIRLISGTIERLSEISSAIAAAVEEQGAATQEISRNVQQAAQGTHDVSSNITAVQHDAAKTGTASSEVLSAAKSLSRDSTRLKQEVGKFLDTVRAA